MRGNFHPDLCLRRTGQVGITADDDRRLPSLVGIQAEALREMILELRRCFINRQTNDHLHIVEAAGGVVDDLNLKLVHHAALDRQAVHDAGLHTGQQQAFGHFHTVGIHRGDGVIPFAVDVASVG